MKNNSFFDILHRDLNVQDVHFLEASAGTGKTFAIEHLVVRLIIEISLSIDQILVMTFTRAAARELKMRIRTNLLRSKEILIARHTSVDYLLHILEKGEDAIRDALKKIEGALICFDGAQIFTIHAFCHRMLTEFAFECKIARALPSLEHVNPSSHYKQAVQDFLMKSLSGKDYSVRQLMLVLKKVKGDPQRLIAKIVSLLSSETDIAAYPGLQELYEKFSAKLSDYPLILPEHFMEDFRKLKSCYRGMGGAAFLKQCEAFAGIVHHRWCSKEYFEDLLTDEKWFLDQMEFKELKINKSLPSDADLHYPGIFRRIKQELLPYIVEASSSMKILLRLAKDCQSHAEVFLSHQECFSPDRMLRRLDAALNHPSFMFSVREKYKAAIVDEFQDTDPIQWRIVKRLFVDALKTICLVGDPKQSIYAFRSADIYTYLDAAQTLGQEKHKYLDTNYRSSPELITALNVLFSAPKGGNWLFLPRIQSAMPVHPVKAGSKQSGMQALMSRGAVHFFLASSEKNRSSQWPTVDCEEHQLFPFIAAEIFALRKKRHVPWEEIAILVKDRFQAMRLQAYLKQAGIPSSFRRGKSLVHSDAWHALKELLQAVLDPSDVSNLKIALGGPLIGWDEAQLRDNLEGLSMQSAKALMQSLHNTLYKKGFGPFFHAFLSAILPLNPRTIGETLLYRNQLELYLDICMLSEILIEEEIVRKCQGEDFLRFLEDVNNTADDENRFEKRVFELHGSVSLMTVHLSKGLEFDTVFALALASRHLIKEGEPVRDGAAQMMVAFEDQHPACAEAIQELDAEKMRFLYVALTRAKQQLYIPFVNDESQKHLKCGDASPIELFFASMSKECTNSRELYEEICRLDKNHVSDVLSALSATCSMSHESISLGKDLISPCEEQESLTLLVPPHRAMVIPEPKWLSSFSSLASQHDMTKTSDAYSNNLIGNQLHPEYELPLGASTGILVHRIFECLLKLSLHHPIQKKKIEDLVISEVEGTSFSPFKKKLIDMAIDQLNLPLLPNGLQLKNIPASQMIQELEFLFPSSSKSMMKGFADLIFTSEGVYYLLDWKTNYLGPCAQDYSQEKIAEAMHTHQYFLQASIYASALKRYVKLFDKRPFEEIFGGALYVFMRGNAVFHVPMEKVIL